MTTKSASVALIAGAALALCACGSKPSVISVGSKNTTEQMILGEILAAHLEKQLPGVRIERKLGLGGTIVVQGALQSGAVDVYVDDSATMLGTVLKEDVPLDGTVGLERARAQYQRLFQLKVLSPLGFHHKFVVVGRTSGVAKVKPDDLSGVGNAGVALMLGVAYDLFDRKDAFSALATRYKISMRELPLRLDPAAMYEALKGGSIDLAAGYSTDAWIDQPGFKVLHDDKELFGAHPACVVARSQALAAQPGLERALEALAGTIKDEAIHKLNQEADLKHRPPAALAKEFLASAGL